MVSVDTFAITRTVTRQNPNVRFSAELIPFNSGRRLLRLNTSEPIFTIKGKDVQVGLNAKSIKITPRLVTGKGKVVARAIKFVSAEGSRFLPQSTWSRAVSVAGLGQEVAELKVEIVLEVLRPSGGKGEVRQAGWQDWRVSASGLGSKLRAAREVKEGLVTPHADTLCCAQTSQPNSTAPTPGSLLATQPSTSWPTASR
jgi:hypothetical protein